MSADDDFGLFDMDEPEPPPMPKTQSADQLRHTKTKTEPSGSTAWEDREGPTWIDRL